MTSERNSSNTYAIVIGIVAAVAIVALALNMSGLNQDGSTPDAADDAAAVAERIRPLGQVFMPGEELAASAPTVVTAIEPEPVATAMSGPQVYNSACLVCHGNGIGGAPVLGDTEAWAPRIAQGLDVLNDHAINGFTNVGYMPPKGARADLSDQEVADAVSYMVAESQ